MTSILSESKALVADPGTGDLVKLPEWTSNDPVLTRAV